MADGGGIQADAGLERMHAAAVAAQRRAAEALAAAMAGPEASPARRLDLLDEARIVLALGAVAILPRPERARLAAALIEDGRAEMAGRPWPALGPVQAEARFWAGLAQPVEHEAYLAAICDVIGEAQTGEAARKRMLLILWESLPDDWRRRFVARVTGASGSA